MYHHYTTVMHHGSAVHLQQEPLTRSVGSVRILPTKNVQKMIEEAKKTVENEDEEGEYTKMFADMRNEQLADTVTESGQIGLAQQLYDNLKQQYKL